MTAKLVPATRAKLGALSSAICSLGTVIVAPVPGYRAGKPGQRVDIPAWELFPSLPEVCQSRPPAPAVGPLPPGKRPRAAAGLTGSR